jgi:uncharacterized phiE125 gp8 family phage protein
MIHYSKVIQPNYQDPVWLSEAKDHLNIESDDTSKDALITQKIVVAAAMCEKYAGLSFMTQTRRVTLDNFYCTGDIILPYGPVQSVTDFIYLDGDDVEQDFTDYTLDTHSQLAKVRVNVGESWPTTNLGMNNVQIDYVAGVANAVDVFPEAREAIFRLVAKLFEHRGDSNDGGLMTEEITDLLDAIKVYWYAG